MFTEKETAKLFPFPVWLFAIEPDKAENLNAAAIAVFDEQRAQTPGHQPGVHWQSRNDLQTLPEFEELNGVIGAAARDVLDEISVEYESFLITGCWANIRPKGSDHPAHTHPNNYLSGSYYVQIPEGGDSICFRDPRPETNIIAPRIKGHTELNARTVMLPIRAGMLVMFPAWLPHFVPANQGESERISISFNVMFSSFAEQLSKPKWTFDAAPKAS